jgi:hypothetical protein
MELLVAERPAQMRDSVLLVYVKAKVSCLVVVVEMAQPHLFIALR